MAELPVLNPTLRNYPSTAADHRHGGDVKLVQQQLHKVDRSPADSSWYVLCLCFLVYGKSELHKDFLLTRISGCGLLWSAACAQGIGPHVRVHGCRVTRWTDVPQIISALT